MPEHGFVFCSFNNSAKIEPVIFGVWMNLLKAVAERVLWLPQFHEVTRRNLRPEAEARGVDGQRLVFAQRIADKERHFARLALADLALDTRMYNGHVTTADALWAGVPVITCRGNHFASRAAASILSALDVSELITESPEEYEALARRFAQNEPELRALHEKIAANRSTQPLFDGPRFVKNLESAYRMMWQHFAGGDGPVPIEVVENP